LAEQEAKEAAKKTKSAKAAEEKARKEAERKAASNRAAYEHEMKKATKKGLIPVHMLHGKERLLRQREIRMAENMAKEVKSKKRHHDQKENRVDFLGWYSRQQELIDAQDHFILESRRRSLMNDMEESHYKLSISRKTQEYSAGRGSLVENCIEIAAEMKQKTLDMEEARLLEESLLCSRMPIAKDVPNDHVYEKNKAWEDYRDRKVCLPDTRVFLYACID